MHDGKIPRETLESVERRRGVLHPTARDAMQHDYATIMVLDGNAGKTDAQHLNTICTFLMSFGDVLTTAQICDRAESCLAARAAAAR